MLILVTLVVAVFAQDDGAVSQELVRPINGEIEQPGYYASIPSPEGEDAPKRDNRQYGALALAAREVGEETSVIIDDAKLLGLFVVALLVTFLIAVIAGTFVGSILYLFGVSHPRVSGSTLATIVGVSLIGLAFSLRLLGINFGEILIGLGILSYSAGKIFGDLASNIVNGFLIRVSPQYQPGMEVTPLQRSFSYNGPRGIIHALELTTILIDMSSPLITAPSPGQAIRKEEIVEPGGPVTLVTQDLLHLSYTDFAGEPHTTHAYNKRYITFLRDLQLSRAKRQRTNMGVILTSAEKMV
jgi:hypothetical protein